MEDFVLKRKNLFTFAMIYGFMVILKMLVVLLIGVLVLQLHIVKMWLDENIEVYSSIF